MHDNIGEYDFNVAYRGAQLCLLLLGQSNRVLYFSHDWDNSTSSFKPGKPHLLVKVTS